MSAAVVKHTVKHLRKKVDMFSGSFTIGASGAVASQDAAVKSGATVTAVGGKTARYLVTMSEKAVSILPHRPVIEGDTDAAIGNTNANALIVRNVGTTTFQIQAILSSSGADTNPASGNKIHWSCELRRI